MSLTKLLHSLKIVCSTCDTAEICIVIFINQKNLIMKNTGKWMLVILALAIAGKIAVAQRGSGRQMDPEKRAANRTEALAKKLGFTPGQKEQLKDLNLRYAQKQFDASEKMKTQRKAIRIEKSEALKRILTPEQVAQWDKMKSERTGRRGTGRQHVDSEARAASRTQHMTSKLSLSPEQADKVKSINESFAKQHDTIRDEAAAYRKAMQKSMKKLRSEQLAALKEVLTPEQFEKLQMRMTRRKADHRGKLRQKGERM